MKINLYLPDDMHEAMQKLPTANWSGIFQKAVRDVLEANGVEVPLGSLAMRVDALEKRMDRLRTGDLPA